MRRADTLARLGGDEFGVLLEGCDLLHAQRIAAAAARGHPRLSLLVGGPRVRRSARASAWPRSPPRAATWRACCRRPTRRAISPRTRAATRSRSIARTTRKCRRAMARWAGFRGSPRRPRRIASSCLCQQVVASASPATATVAEYLELLLRMRDEQGRVVSPMAFIPAAERYHLMGTIDRWVVGQAPWVASRACAALERAAPCRASASICRA